MGLYEQIYLNAWELRQYVKIEHDADDVMLDAMFRAACDWVEHYLCTDFEEVPPAVKIAVYKLMAHWFENRGDIVQSYRIGDYSVNMDGNYSEVKRILNKYRLEPGI